MILAIDTSSAISVAICAQGAVLASAHTFEPRGHAELLAGLVARALGEAGASPAEVTEVVVGTGPAPFTGLRVGLVTARVFARARNIPVFGVCSLDALGAEHAAAAGGVVAVIADARRREVYAAIYDDGVPISGPEVASPSEVRARLDRSHPAAATIGRGALAYPEAFPAAPPDALVDPDPAWLVRVRDAARARGDATFPTEPLYLRRPDVHGARAT